MIRQPVITVVGHVDHGKTSLLDWIRGSAVTATEAGLITQAIGASIIPMAQIKKLCAPLLERKQLQFTIPGLLFIDTPGHAAFVNLRKRGGALADIAVLVIDINEGFKPQTLESIEILKNDKVPFVVAANKIDLVLGWRSNSKPLIQNIQEQSERTQQEFDTKVYELVGKLFELGFQAERFDRVSDYTKQLAIVPVSAKTGEGVPELLMVLAGLAQKFLEQQLRIEVTGQAQGSVLEVKEEKGLGTTIDVLLYDGALHVNDTVVVGGVEKPVVTKIRALLQPQALQETRVKKTKFTGVESVHAATVVKISAPELGGVVSGMPLRSVVDDAEVVAREIQAEVKEVLFETDAEGVVAKADTLGSLEALIVLLRSQKIKIKSASVGAITKKDVAEAQVAASLNPFYGVILGFNVEVLPEADELCEKHGIKTIVHEIIYHIIDDYTQWKDAKKKAIELAELNGLVRGAKIRILPGHVFRQSNPAVVGIEVLAGRLRAGEPLMNAAGKKLTVVKELQEHNEAIPSVEAGKQVALSMDKVMVGRQINEGDILYTDVPDENFRKMKELKHYLAKADAELLKEIASIKRKDNPTWGI